MKFNLGCPKPLKDITLDDAIRIIDGVDSFTADPKAGKTGELSIRKGRYGHYVYYKTADERPEVLQHKEVQGSI
jgi:topoisomerase IA-like protein